MLRSRVLHIFLPLFLALAFTNGFLIDFLDEDSIVYELKKENEKEKESEEDIRESRTSEIKYDSILDGWGLGHLDLNRPRYCQYFARGRSLFSHLGIQGRKLFILYVQLRLDC